MLLSFEFVLFFLDINTSDLSKSQRRPSPRVPRVSGGRGGKVQEFGTKRNHEWWAVLSMVVLEG